MAVRLSIDVQGEQVFRRAFNRVSDSLKDFTPIWPAVAAKFYRIEQDQFRSGGAKGASGKWAELTPASERWKVAKYGTFALFAGPMIASEATLKSLTSKDAPGSVYQAEKDELTLGTSLPYPAYHMQRSGKRPARRVIDLSEASKRELQKEIQKAFVPLVRSAGFVQTSIGDFD